MHSGNSCTAGCFRFLSHLRVTSSGRLSHDTTSPHGVFTLCRSVQSVWNELSKLKSNFLPLSALIYVSFSKIFLQNFCLIFHLQDITGTLKCKLRVFIVLQPKHKFLSEPFDHYLLAYLQHFPTIAISFIVFLPGAFSPSKCCRVS